MIQEWKKDLLEEKNLREVFRKSRKLNKSTFNQGVYVFSFIVGAAICVLWITKNNIDGAASAAIAASDVTFNLSVQILGFLIGGFAIFTTLADQKLMVNLAKIPMGDSGLSVFKNVFFNFLSVFFIYIITLAFSFSVKIFSGIDVIDCYSVLSVQVSDKIVLVFNCIVFLTIYFTGVVAVVRIKSFIWNIYQAFLTCLIAGHVIDEANPL